MDDFQPDQDQLDRLLPCVVLLETCAAAFPISGELSIGTIGCQAPWRKFSAIATAESNPRGRRRPRSRQYRQYIGNRTISADRVVESARFEGTKRRPVAGFGSKSFLTKFRQAIAAPANDVEMMITNRIAALDKLLNLYPVRRGRASRHRCNSWRDRGVDCLTWCHGAKLRAA